MSAKAAAWAARSIGFFIITLHRGEGSEFRQPLEGDGGGLPPAVLGDDALGLVALVTVLVIVVVSVEEHDHVGVLLNGARTPGGPRGMGRLSERLVVGTGELGQAGERDVEFLGMIFRARLMSATTCWRFSPAYRVVLPEDCISCK